MKTSLNTNYLHGEILQAAFDNEPSAQIFKIDDGKIFMVNIAACKMFGYTNEEFLLLERKDFVLEDKDEITNMNLAFQDDSTSGIVKFRKKDAGFFIGRASVKTIAANSGIKYHCFTITDITEEEGLNSLLLKKDQELHNILKFSTDIITVADQSGKRIYVSDSINQMYGYTPEELIGKQFIDVVYEEDKEKTLKIFSQLFQPNTIKYFENRVVRKDGTLLNLLWSFNVDDESGYAYMMGKDITEKIKIEIALKKSERNYRSLINNLKTGVLKQGLNTEILLSNPAALEMLGLTEDQLMGRTSFHPDWNIIHENGDDFSSSTHPVSVAIATQEPVNNIIMGVYRPLTKDRVWLMVNADPAFKDTGELDHVICTFNDITQQFQLQEQLRENEKALLAKNLDLQNFAHIASHDLKEPLRMVNSFMKLFQKKYADIVDETGKKYISIAVDGTDRMKVLIEELLSYSLLSERIEKLETVDMNSIASDVIALYNNENYQVDAEIIVGDLPIINASKTAMTQLIQNLLGNALKYKGTAKPIVTISGKEY